MKYLQDYIVVTGPLLSPEQCREIIAVTEGCEWRAVDQTPTGRTCTTFPISKAAVEQNNERIKAADALLVQATHLALQEYVKKFPYLRTNSDTGFDILRYETGQKIGVHVDNLGPRYLTMSIGLNDDYTGGEFRFWGVEAATCRLLQGYAIMFPPTFQYPHEILPVISGTRYSMITWFV